MLDDVSISRRYCQLKDGHFKWWHDEKGYLAEKDPIEDVELSNVVIDRFSITLHRFRLYECLSNLTVVVLLIDL